MNASNTINPNCNIFASFMSRNFFTSVFCVYLAALLLLGTAAPQFQKIGQSKDSTALSNEPIAEQLKVSSLRPLFADINFSGLQQIIIQPIKVVSKNKTAFLKQQEAQFDVKWKFATLQVFVMDFSLSISKIIFPSHFFW